MKKNIQIDPDYPVLPGLDDFLSNHNVKPLTGLLDREV